MNNLNLRSVEKVVVVLPELCRLDQTDILVFKSHFENCIVGIKFGVLNESVARILDLFILVFYSSIGGRG